ncbi:DUF814 domain-containing protein [Candidatus Micrarchaeota archaeon]|nr:DUF814 domain-containing protein [Candidatus Micrarchaeota archaeon]
MKITLDSRKSIHENAAAYFERAKKAREKRAGALVAMEDLRRHIAELERMRKIAGQEAVEKTALVRKEAAKREWFEKFHHFRTSGGLLCIAGKDAKSNEIIVARHLEQGDLFLHADIQGAPATILKGGKAAGAQDRREAAQLAASFSSAWKRGFTAVDVYCVDKSQVSKSAQSGEYVPKGGFIIRGTREWFRSVPLELAVGFDPSGKLAVVPNLLKGTLAKAVQITPGEKRKVAEGVVKALALSKMQREELMQVLP